MNDWPALLPCILGMSAIFVLPGCLSLFAIGAQRAKLFLGSPLISLAIIGLATIPSAWTPWGITLVLLVTVVVGALAIAVRSIARKTRPTNMLRMQWKHLKGDAHAIGMKRASWLIGGVTVTAAITFAMTAFAVPDTNHFPQNYDAVFHMSVVRHILDTGCASPLGAGSVMGSANAVYPDVWHALVALTSSFFGISLSQGVWTVVLTLLMVVLPCSACLLTSSLFELDRCFSFLFAATLPVIASASAASFVTFGPLYANLCGLAVLPAAIAFVILAFEKTGTERRRAIALSLLAGVLGLGFTHPNTVFTLTLFLLPLFIAQCKRWWQRVGITGLFALCWAACMSISLFARTVNCLDRVAEDVERGESLARLVGIPYDSLAVIGWLPLALSVFLVAVGATVAVALSKRWENSWYIAALSLLAALATCAFFPTNWFSRIATGFWYRDYYRLAIMFVMFAFIAVAAVPEVVLALARNGKQTRGRHSGQARQPLRAPMFAGALACIVIFVAIAGIGFRSHCADFRDTTIASEAHGTVALTTQRASFCEQVASLTGSSTVLNNHNDASVWLYPIYGVNALAKGLPANQMDDMDRDYQLLITSINRYGANDSDGEKVRQAAERLGVEYLVQMGLAPDSISEFSADNTISYVDHEAENKVTEDTPGFELVLEEDGMRLWKLSS